MTDAATITTQDDYQHVKTGGIYTVISTATMEATGELVVVVLLLQDSFLVRLVAFHLRPPIVTGKQIGRAHV